VRQVFLAGKEPQERPPLAGFMLANCSPQHGVARFERIEHGPLCWAAIEVELNLIANAGQGSQMIGKQHADHGRLLSALACHFESLSPLNVICILAIPQLESSLFLKGASGMSRDSGLSRLQLPLQQPWFAVISPLQRIGLSAAIAASVFLAGGTLDWFVTREYLPRVSLMLGGAAIALGIGLLTFQTLTNIQTRYQMMLDRLQSVAELNHHIRNALQIIAYHNVPDRGDRAIQQVNAQVTRIHAALRAVSAALGEESDSSGIARVSGEPRYGS
jgi:hypothetical protein